MKYKSGIEACVKVRFGGRIAIGLITEYGENVHGLTLSEFAECGEVGVEPKNQERTEPIVTLLFDNVKSIDMLKEVLDSVRSRLEHNPYNKPQVLDMSVYDCFCVRTANILRPYNINTIRDLVRLKECDLLNFPKGGKKFRAEIKDFLAKNNLKFEMDV